MPSITILPWPARKWPRKSDSGTKRLRYWARYGCDATHPMLAAFFFFFFSFSSWL